MIPQSRVPFQSMVLFLRVAQSPSLSAAARTAGCSTPTLTHAVDELESQLQVSLLARSTRGIRLTEAGIRFAQDCQRLMDEIASAERSARGLHEETRGSLTIAAPLLFGQHVLTPVMLEFLELHPAIRMQARFRDQLPHLYEDGLDVAVLMGDLPDSSLTVIKVGVTRQLLVASPAYLDRHGTPTRPEALQSHLLIHVPAEAPVLEWQFGVQPEVVRVRVRPRLSLSTRHACIEAAAAGAGITRCLSYQAQPQLLSGRLCRILQAYEPPPLPLYLAYREGHRAAARVRGFVDFAAARLKSHPALQLSDRAREP